ncbi:hypothetical protein DLM85_01975 [Hymenobacter edaphi]|uniref:PKD domain-containing protein n=1 Tax=Hymenobacter edaphi TaxID=2211146 RepID=A0A328BSW5_9BACT|nr:hypothetical protein DLM85_01975 [Hymenobacter edaphi]
MLGLGLLAPARAQGVYARWDFGQRAGLYFGADSVRALTDSQLQSEEASATVCDEQGGLLFYGNGEQLWNRQHQPMSNGQALGGSHRAAQGCAIVAKPGQPGRYYVFTLDALENQPRNGLLLAEVDMAAAGGLGSVVSKRGRVLPDTLLQRFGTTGMAEEMALVRHANGRDYWLVTHLYYANVFVSVLLRAGVAPGSQYVVSAVGRTIGFSGVIPFAGGGSMAVTLDGRRLAYTYATAATELLNFDPATGRLSNPVRLEIPPTALRTDMNPYHYGAAFSPDGRFLYTSLVQPDSRAEIDQRPNVFVVQYFLQPVVTSVAQSGLVVYSTPQSQQRGLVSRFVRGLQRGPDGLIYAAVNNGRRLDVIRQPNQRGGLCEYTVDGRPLAGRVAQLNLPLLPNDVFYPSLRLASLPCPGLTRTLTVSGTALGVLGDTLLWQLGDGQVRQTTTASLTYTYAPGQYTATVQLLRHRRPQATATLAFTAEPALRVQLGPDTSLCATSEVLLLPGAQPAGTTYRWQDGSTAAALRVTAPGTYWLELRTPAGCTARDTVVVGGEPCRTLVPNVITPNGDRQNDAFVLKGMNAAEWRCRVFSRWGRLVYQAEAYANDWDGAAQPAGTYFYELINRRTGQRLKGTVEVVR